MGLKVAVAHLAQFGVVDEVRAVSVDEGTERQAILPAGQRKWGVRPGDLKLCSPQPRSAHKQGSLLCKMG